MRIGIDIDDTLTNTKEVQKIYWKKYHQSHPNDEYTDDIPDNINVFGYPYIEDFWEIYREQLSFDCTFKEGASQVLNRLRDEGHTICIITSRPDKKYKNLKGRLEKWFKDNNIYYDEIYTDSRHKGITAKENNVDIIIDDCDYHLEEAKENGIKGILFNDEESKEFPTVDNWYDLYSVINNIIKNSAN